MKPDKASATAHLIAVSTVALAQQTQFSWLVPERAALLSERFSATQPNRLPFFYRKLQPALERFTLPGIKLHYALRKRYLEETARDFLAGGGAQIVVLGAGFDTLALRLHQEFPAAQFLEVDHPATQGAKTGALRRPDKDASNLRFVPLDLTRSSLAATLSNHPDYSATTRTLFVAEGLLMYLPPSEVDTLFSFIRSADSRFAFTFMARRDDGRIAFRNASVLVNWWLRWRGEPFRWGLYEHELTPFLHQRGFHQKALATSETLRQCYLAPRNLADVALAEGELICVADSQRKE